MAQFISKKKIQINIDDITLTENNIFQNISLSLSLVFSVLLPLILIKVSENLNKVAQNNKKKKGSYYQNLVSQNSNPK